MTPELLKILVCPLTRGPLIWEEEKQHLLSPAAGLAYPVRNGVPIMLPEEATPVPPAAEAEDCPPLHGQPT